MKNLLIILSVIFFGTAVANGQNYIGLNQSKILKRFGTPDSTGANYFVYIDPQEEGTNTYFFDDNNNCEAFVITRTSIYYSDYQRQLNKVFTKTIENTYVHKSKKMNLKAELAKTSNEFQIRITYTDSDIFHYVQNIVEN
jgi:hypothetical protein